MRCLISFLGYIIPTQGIISLPAWLYFISISFLLRGLFHCLLRFISFLFIPTQGIISLPAHIYFISISFLPRQFFHCLPSFISFLFHSYLRNYFIACLALFHFHFISTQEIILLLAWLYFISILFLPREYFHCLPSFILFLFHCLPRFISFLFHSYPGNYFIACLASFHFHFIPTQGIILLLA